MATTILASDLTADVATAREFFPYRPLSGLYDAALEDRVILCDQRREAAEAFASGRETRVVVLGNVTIDDFTMHLIYFPESGRGAVDFGGGSEWTDCDGIDDLFDRVKDRTLWSN